MNLDQDLIKLWLNLSDFNHHKYKSCHNCHFQTNEKEIWQNFIWVLLKITCAQTFDTSLKYNLEFSKWVSNIPFTV